jgi:hypothetical protein
LEKIKMNTAFISLANRKCNTCGHLVLHEKDFHDSCHFSNGNDSCPAKTFQIGVGVNVEKASQAIADALFNGDVVALQRHVNKLATYKPVQTREVLAAVFNKYALLYGIEVADDAASDEEEADGDEDGEADDTPEQESGSTTETAQEPETPVTETAAAAAADATPAASDDEWVS